ncbi:hypothetical protein E2320_017941, partial [Naja naja]
LSQIIQAASLLPRHIRQSAPQPAPRCTPLVA